jgi:hypothetical protein
MGFGRPFSVTIVTQNRYGRRDTTFIPICIDFTYQKLYIFFGGDVYAKRAPSGNHVCHRLRSQRSPDPTARYQTQLKPKQPIAHTKT